MTDTSSAMPLGIAGFTYADLHAPARLRDLHELFCRDVESRNPALWVEWDAYRRDPEAVRSPIELSDLIATGDNQLGTGNQVVIFSGADLMAGRFPGLGATPIANFSVGGQSPTALVSVATVNADGDRLEDLAVGSGAGQASLVKVYKGTNLSGGSEPASSTLDPFGGITLNGVFVG